MTFLLSILFVFYLSLVITSFDGPLNIFKNARENSPEPLGELLSCYVCLSPYLSILPAFWLATSWQEFILYTFGIAGGAVLIHKVAERG